VKEDLLEGIDLETITEEEFLDKAVERIGTIQKTKNKTLSKDSFVKIFKFTGEFAKLRSKDIKKAGQIKRCAEFGKNAKKYLELLKDVIQEEEKAYEKSSTLLFDKLCISPEFFERSQQELMYDPYASMELFNMGIGMELPSTGAPEELTK
jgi:hypothetical protein